MKVILLFKVQVGGLGADSKQSQVVFCLDIILQFDTGSKNFEEIRNQGKSHQKLTISE